MNLVCSHVGNLGAKTSQHITCKLCTHTVEGVNPKNPAVTKIRQKERQIFKKRQILPFATPTS